MKSLGLIGFGSFSKLILRYLVPYFDVCIYSRRDVSSEIKESGVSQVSLEEASSKDIIVISKPVQYIEELLKKMKDFLKPGALIIDVSSVKVRPVELMKKYLPETVDILGTHPLFGPKSGKNGIKKLKIVLCPVRMNNHDLNNIKSFLGGKLELQVFVKTPEEHDRDAAYIMSLTHLIGKALKKMDLPSSELNTKSYQHLADMFDMIKDDSDDLFFTIQKENPYAEKVRKKFIKNIKEIEDKLDYIKT